MASNSGKTNAEPFQTTEILILSMGHFIHDVYSGFLAPLLPLLINKLSMSLTQAGFLSTVMQIPHLLNPYIGLLADRVSVRYFIILTPALTAVPMSLLGAAPTYGVVALLLFIAGISVALFHVPAPVMVARLSGNQKGRGMSFYMSGGEFARSLSPLVAVGAVSLLGLEGYYPIMIVGLASSAWLYVRFRDLPVQINSSRRPSLANAWRQTGRILRPLAAVLVFRGLMHGSMTTFLPTFIRAETGNLWLAGAGLTIFEAAGVAGVITAGTLSDNFGRRRILLLSLLITPWVIMLFAWVEGWFRYLMLVCIGFSLLATTPVMLAMVQEHAGDSPAAANGLFMMVSFLARSATVVLVGWIADGIGLQATYAVSAGLGLLAVPFALKLPR